MNANEWTVEYPPLFTDIDWNVQSFMPLEYEQKTAYPPFQRRRSSSVDLPLNPLYSNAGRIQSQPTIQEEPAIRNWSPLEFNTDNTFTVSTFLYTIFIYLFIYLFHTAE
jgi:hypothetical protein